MLEVDSSYLSIQGKNSNLWIVISLINIQFNFILLISDRSYWNNSFKLKLGISNDDIPILSRDFLQDVLICGKSLCLLRQCQPDVSCIWISSILS